MSIWRKLMSGFEQEPFIFEVTVSNNETITLPFVEVSGVSFECTVDWGDSSSSTILAHNDINRIHTYTTAGTYPISISGICPGFRVNNASIRNNIISILQFGTVGFRFLDFFGCSLITTIPDGDVGFSNLLNVANFMRSTGITTIPANIFVFSPGLLSAVDAFSFTNITQIPSGLFNNNTVIQDFNSCFNGCVSLTEIPSTLFNNNTQAINFGNTFRSCINITSIPIGLFDSNQNVTTFEGVFRMPTTSNALTGNAPTLWTRIPEPAGTGAFRNCTGLDNFNIIPANWK